MSKMLYMQQRMDEKIVPLPDKKVINSFAEAFESPEVSIDWKLHWIAQVSIFMTLNCVTKRDLQAAMRWLFEQNYESDLLRNKRQKTIKTEKEALDEQAPTAPRPGLD